MENSSKSTQHKALTTEQLARSLNGFHFKKRLNPGTGLLLASLAGAGLATIACIVELLLDL